MNDICELWHLPWHALQKDLALGLGADPLRLRLPAVKSANMQVTAVVPHSWLGRALLRAAPTTTTRF